MPTGPARVLGARVTSSSDTTPPSVALRRAASSTVAVATASRGSTGTGPSPRTARGERGIEGVPRARQRWGPPRRRRPRNTRPQRSAGSAPHALPQGRRRVPGEQRVLLAVHERAHHVAAGRPGDPEPRPRARPGSSCPTGASARRSRASAPRRRRRRGRSRAAATRRRPTRPVRGGPAPGRRGDCRSRAACRRPRPGDRARDRAARSGTRTGSARRARPRRPAPARSGSRSPSAGSGTAPGAARAVRRARRCAAPRSRRGRTACRDTTASPSSRAWSVSSLWVAAGVEIATASAPAARRASSESKVASPGWSDSTRARRSGEEVTTPRKSHSAAAAQQRGVEPPAAEAVAHEPDPDRFHPCACRHASNHDGPAQTVTLRNGASSPAQTSFAHFGRRHAAMG